MFVLREWRLEDIPDVAHFANNRKIAANLRNAFPYPYGMEDAKGYVECCMNGDEYRQLCLAIEVEGRAVGSIGIFLGEDIYEKSAEVGYWLAEAYWGKGIMSEAVKQICERAFKHFDILRIYAEPFLHNRGSCRVLEKAGFVLEGIMRRGAYKNGEILDWCMYAYLGE